MTDDPGREDDVADDGPATDTEDQPEEPSPTYEDVQRTAQKLDIGRGELEAAILPIEPGTTDTERMESARREREYIAEIRREDEKRTREAELRAEFGAALEKENRPTITLPSGEVIKQNPDGSFEHSDGTLLDPTLPDSVIGDLTPIIVTGGPAKPEPPPPGSATDEPPGPPALVDPTRSTGFWSSWDPWLKVAVPLVAAGVVAGGTFVLLNGGNSTGSDPAAPAAVVEVQDDGGVQDDAAPDDVGAGEATEGVTTLEVVPCRSETEGCDDKGDVAIVGAPAAGIAAGADLSFAASGYDPFADEERGEHQFQLALSGDGAGVSESPDTASYTVEITAETDAGQFSLSLLWEQGVLVQMVLVTVDGVVVEDPVVSVDWTDESRLWVAIQGTGAPMPSTSANVSVTTEVLNADGTPGARVSDTASA